MTEVIIGLVVLSAALLFAYRQASAKESVPQRIEIAPPLIAPGAGKVPLDTAVHRISTALAKFETGYRQAGEFPWNDPKQWKGIAQRNLNPGNLRSGIGQSGTSGGYAVFPTATAGRNALYYDVRAKLTGKTRTGLTRESTLDQFIQAYAPRNENPSTLTGTYQNFVANELGILRSAKFSEWVAV